MLTSAVYHEFMTNSGEPYSEMSHIFIYMRNMRTMITGMGQRFKLLLREIGQLIV
jgi:hypothetical protein